MASARRCRSNDGYTVVSKIIPGGAADKDGRLKPEDQIVGVGQGDDGEIVDVVDMKLNDVVELIRGKRGTVVRLEVIPAGEHRAEDLQHHPRQDRTERQRSPRRDLRSRHEARRQPYKIGVIDLPSFYMDMEGARARRARLQEHHPRRAQASSTTSTTRASMPWCSTCGATAAAR